MPYCLCPIPDLTPFAVKADKKGKKSIEVTYPVSYRYNGGIIVGNELYEGFDSERLAAIDALSERLACM